MVLCGRSERCSGKGVSGVLERSEWCCVGGVNGVVWEE